MHSVLQYIEENRDRYLEELKALLRIPSVSTDPTQESSMGEAAHFIADQLEACGFRSQITATPGHPIVFAERMEDENRPTALVYGHYDVQPVDPIDLWESDPFDPSVRSGRIYARGATDDKGQLFIHLKSAEAFKNVIGELPVNLKFLIEGEEEIGSPNLDPFVRENLELLKADTVLISDTSMFSKETPSICYGLRGLSYFQIEVTGPKSDLHSGSFGGPIPNPAMALAQMLSKMRDDEGRVSIPHFYDEVVELSDREKQEFAALPFDEENYKQSLGVKELEGESGYSPLEQVWARPTFEVNGLLSGFTGEGAKTVLPSKAMAKISMRLVPNQDPDRIGELFTAYLQEIAPSSVHVQVTPMHGGKPWVAPLDHVALIAAGIAIEKGFGKKPVFQREGGSIPVVATFSELLGIPTVLMGIGLPDENAHAPNENLDLDNFFRGIQASAHFLEELARDS